MDIITLAAWGEFLGGIAVVVSLIYLAGQIRQNSRLLRASTASATSAANTSVNTLLVQDPEVSRIFYDGMAEPSSLSEADQGRFNALIGMLMANLNQEYQFAQDGVIATTVWVQREQTFRMLLQQPGFRQCWNQLRGIYGDEFGEFVDGLIREGEVAAPKNFFTTA